jgi:hypothetical protein
LPGAGSPRMSLSTYISSLSPITCRYSMCIV